MSEEKGIYQVTGKKTFKEILDSPEMELCRKAIQESEDQYKKEVESFWDNLSYDDKLKAFFYVCSKIYKSDVEDQGSYRHCLYSCFSFYEDSYMIGMDAGYMSIHNLIHDGIEYNKIKNAKSILLDDNAIMIADDHKIDFAYDDAEEILKIKKIENSNFFRF